MINVMNYFDEWNNLKKEINSSHPKVFFKERDIFYVSLGQNVGFEENGKGQKFSRPVIVLRKFNNMVFLCVPLTSSVKEGEFYFNFYFNNKGNSAILSQIKLIDSNRLLSKIGMISDKDFNDMKRKISKLLKLADFS
jgi:mRNA interferase MazF